MSNNEEGVVKNKKCSSETLEKYDFQVGPLHRRVKQSTALRETVAALFAVV